MSDFDPKDIHEEVVPSGSSDFDPADIHVEKKHKEDKGTVDAFTKGIEQGALLQHADETQGLIGASTDAVQSLLNKIGIADPSASQVNAKLKEQGFKGDIGPTDFTETYRADRDEAREDYDAAQKNHPYATFAGNVVGGVGTMKVLPTAFMAPLGEAGAAAPLIDKVGLAAANSLPMGVAIGSGASNADLTQGQTEDFARDVTGSAMLGAALNGAMPIAGEGLKLGGKAVKATTNAAGDYIQDKFPSVARAYQKGTEGIKTGSQDFVDSTNEKLKKLTDTLKDYTVKARNEVTAANEENISNINSQIDDVQKDIKQSLQMTKKASKTMGEVQKQQLENQKMNLAQKIQDKVQGVKDQIKGTYDKIENQIASSGVSFNMNPQITRLGEELQNNGMLPKDADQYLEEFKPFFEKQQLTYPELQVMKQKLAAKMNAPVPAVQRAFSTIYKSVNDGVAEQLHSAGMTDLANTLKNTNQKYAAISDLENTFLGKLNQDRILHENLLKDGTISAIDDAAKISAKKANSTDEFVKKLINVDPTAENDVVPNLNDLVSRIRENKTIRPSINMDSPEIQEKQAILDQLKQKLTQAQQAPEVKTQMDALMQSNEKQINDYIGNNIKNVNNPLLDPARQNMENVINSYESTTGNKIKDEAQELIKDTELIKSSKKGTMPTISPRGLKFGEGALQTPANAVGRAVKTVKDVKEPLVNGVKSLSDMGDAQLGTVIERMKTAGSAGQEFARVLESTLGKPSQTKNAIIFGLMQQPGFRELYTKQGQDSGQ